MAKKNIKVQGIIIKVEKNDYVSLTDIAKQSTQVGYASEQDFYFIIRNWFHNQTTLLFLETWEIIHNPEFNQRASTEFREKAVQRSFPATAQNYIRETNAIGLISKSGRYGGTFAHEDIALNFCYWISPVFQLYFIQEFRRMKKQELLENTTDWALNKVLDSADSIRILVETIQDMRTGIETGEEE